MNLNKRGQIGKILVYAAVVIAVILIAFFIYRAVSKKPNNSEAISKVTASIISDCLKNQDPALDIIPFAKNDINLCSAQNTYKVSKEMCEFNFYLYQSFENSFSDCDGIKNDRAKEVCNLLKGKDASKCSQLGEDRFQCEAIIKDDVSICKNAANTTAQNICSNIFYFYNGLSKKDASQCENVVEIKKVEDGDRWFNSQKVRCYYITRHDATPFDSNLSKRCELDELIATLEPVACDYTKEEYKTECKSKINEINNCLSSYSDAGDKKNCIGNIIQLYVFCGRDGLGPSINAMPDSSGKDTKKKQAINANPGIC